MPPLTHRELHPGQELLPGLSYQGIVYQHMAESADLAFTDTTAGAAVQRVVWVNAPQTATVRVGNGRVALFRIEKVDPHTQVLVVSRAAFISA